MITTAVEVNLYLELGLDAAKNMGYQTYRPLAL